MTPKELLCLLPESKARSHMQDKFMALSYILGVQMTTRRKFVRQSALKIKKSGHCEALASHKGLLKFFNLVLRHLYLGNTVSSWHTGLLNHTVHVASHQTEACDSFWILCNVLTSRFGSWLLFVAVVFNI